MRVQVGSRKVVDSRFDFRIKQCTNLCLEKICYAKIPMRTAKAFTRLGGPIQQKIEWLTMLCVFRGKQTIHVDVEDRCKVYNAYEEEDPRI